MDIYHEILYQYWGYTSFRPLQEDIIHSVAKGEDTLGLMPTGGGKSLTFQVPAMTMEGLCLVVTPLIALMKDQVDNLKNRGIKALAIYGGMTYQEILVTLENAILGDYKFLYVSPERLSTNLFLAKLKDMQINLLVVDEAHCISQWGYDFRPSYMNIVEIRKFIPDIPVLALTATATPNVIDDIQKNLNFKEKNVLKQSYKRDNLAYSVFETESKVDSLIRVLKKNEGSSIVYVRNRQKTKEIVGELLKVGFSADYYHAGLGNEEKTRKQNAWKNDECRIMVSTNAFGMGIDKPDVRLVVHIDLPNSIEEYFQEAGRGGRDEKKSHSIILYTKTDSRTLRKRVSDEFPEKDFVLRIYELLAYFLQIAEGHGLGFVYDFNLSRFCSVYKLPILPTHNALKILDLANYIEYTDEQENRSRIIFRVYRDDLYRYDFDGDFDQLVNLILRQYTGVFTSYVYIDEGLLSMRLNKTRDEVYNMLKILGKQGVIDYIPHKKTPFIIYKQPRLDIKYVSISKSVYEERKKRFKDRIEAMNSYVERSDVCRSRMLLAYFGETDSEECGQCDVCLSKATGGELTSEKFDKIFQEMKNILNKESLSIQTLIDRLPQFSSEDVIKVIRFQIDKETVSFKENKLIINN